MASLSPIRSGLYGDSQFYKANGECCLFHTCNSWSAEVLQVGGLDISPGLSLTAGSVLGTVRRQGHAPNSSALRHDNKRNPVHWWGRCRR